MSKLLQSQYEDKPIVIGNMVINCAVLEDETRVISQRAFNAAIGVPEGGAQDLPRFLAPKALESFIDEALRARISNPIEYQPLHGGRTALGIPAELLEDVFQEGYYERNDHDDVDDPEY